MRDKLRESLGTLPVVAFEIRPTTNAPMFAKEASSILGEFADALARRQRTELLLGFPAAPFVLPFAADNADAFLDYVSSRPAHEIRLRRGREPHAEWTVTPIGYDVDDVLFRDRRGGYRLTFTLPEGLEAWIAEHEEQRSSRARAVKSQYLSDIVIYRMEGDTLRTYQLQYDSGNLRRG